MSTPAGPLTEQQLLNSGMIELKDAAVNFSQLDTELLLFCAAAAQLHSVLFHKPLVITSARDSKHGEHSKHYAGKAVDIRLHDIEPLGLLLFVSGCDYMAGHAGCGVFHEFPGTDDEHLHVETNA
jgi:hypothetical protein